MSSTDPPVTIVIFGASGDLTDRKLLPALYQNFRKGRLPEQFAIVGYARTPFSLEEFKAHVREGIAANGTDFDADIWDDFATHLWYYVGEYEQPEAYQHFNEFLQSLEHGPSGRIYYLATIPATFPLISEQLGRQQMTLEAAGAYRRIVVEKPFGVDLASALALNDTLHTVFHEEQIYRIDHYLGKETAQNILFFRFANIMFEPIWNRNYIDNVQITVEETVDIGRRGAFYERIGVLRDMFQNHLLQLLALVAMEPPSSMNADQVRDEKSKVFSAIQPIRPEDILLGQYDGYQQAKGVATDSQIPTYAAMRFHIENWRWQGVPFYLRSGKALARKASEIVIEFKYPPAKLFNTRAFTPNLLSLCIQPNEGIHVKFEAKVPDSLQETRPVDMDFHYHDQFPGKVIPDAYERLLLDVIHGDASLFPRTDAIEIAWRLFDPIVHRWQQSVTLPLYHYEPGSWGPLEVHQLLLQDGRYWRIGCDCDRGSGCA